MYTPEFRKKRTGVPVLSKDEIDSLGERLVADFCPEALKTPMAIDIDGFAQYYLGLKQDFQYLSHNGIYLGMMVFHNTDKIPVYDPVNRRAEYLSAEARTVIIDNSLLEEGQERRYRFTMGHESAHAILHSGYYGHAANRTTSSGAECAPMVRCRIDYPGHANKRREYWTDNDWMEWQANNLASSLLMTKCMVHKLTDGMNAKSSAFQSAACMRAVSNTFNVSLQAAEIRLKDLGIMGNFAKSDIEYELDFLPRII